MALPGLLAARAAPYLQLWRRWQRSRQPLARSVAGDVAALHGGGLSFDRDIVAPCPGACQDPGGGCTTGTCARARGVALLVQPDGDVLLSLPRDFAGTPAEVAAARAMMTDAHRRLGRLAAVGPLSLLAGGVAVGSDVASFGVAAAGAVGAGAGLGEAVAAGPLVAAVAAPLVRRGVGTAAGWVVRRLFGRGLGG